MSIIMNPKYLFLMIKTLFLIRNMTEKLNKQPLCTSIDPSDLILGARSITFPMHAAHAFVWRDLHRDECMMGGLAFHWRGGHHCMWPTNTDIFPELENHQLAGNAYVQQQCVATLCLSHPSIHAHTRTIDIEIYLVWLGREREKLGFWCDVQIGDCYSS